MSRCHKLRFHTHQSSFTADHMPTGAKEEQGRWYNNSCVTVQVCEASSQRAPSHAEMLLVGQGLKRDFKRYGVHLSADKQQQLAAATQAVHTTGMQIGTDPQLRSHQLQSCAASVLAVGADMQQQLAAAIEAVHITGMQMGTESQAF